MTQTTTVTLLAAALGAALLGFTGTGAFAQSDTPAPKPITLKLGAFFPSGSFLKNATSDTWFSAGAEYAVVPHGGAGAAQSLIPLGYVDYAGSNRHGVNARYIGVGPGVRYNLSTPGSSSLVPYVGAGIGAYFLRAASGGSSSSKTNFGYRLNAGVEFNQSYLLEINYTDPQSVSGTRFSGFNLQAGVKF